MFTDITWQDWLGCGDRGSMILEAVTRYKASRDFARALEASCYFRGDNTAVARKTILRARKVEIRDASGRRRVRAATQDVVGNRIPSGFLFRFVTQQNQYLLSEGVGLPAHIRPRLGADFDQQLELLGEKALLHGTAWGYWNTDHLEVIEAAKNPRSGFVPLLDELTGTAMVGIQFWQVSPQRPLYIRLFELDGVSLLRQTGDTLETVEPKRPYLLSLRSDALGQSVAAATNYDALPVIPLHANADRLSELTPAIKQKIDAYDHILSDFADNLDRANDVYWVLNNFGGTVDDVAELLEEINRVKAVANLSDGSGTPASAEPRTIEVPYAARKTALDLLERALYQDYMALDMDALTGGSLTNVAIRTAMAAMDLKADRYEWQVRRFVSDLLWLIGCPTEEIRFKRQAIANQSEIVADIAVMRGDIDRRTALRLNPYVQFEEIEGVLGEA